ncbi:MAG: thiamine S protein [Methanomicrobiales archaeon]|nr:thiamine S protein [Methanomicrobiales archaeon]
MRVQLPDGTVRTVDVAGIPVEEVLASLGVNPVEVIVTRNGSLVPEDAMAGADDEIRLVRISHGG